MMRVHGHSEGSGSDLRNLQTTRTLRRPEIPRVATAPLGMTGRGRAVRGRAVRVLFAVALSASTAFAAPPAAPKLADRPSQVIGNEITPKQQASVEKGL